MTDIFSLVTERRIPEAREATSPTHSRKRVQPPADVTVYEFVAAGGFSSFRPNQGGRMTAPLTKLAYSLDAFAEAVDLSKAQLRKHIDAGDLRPSYSGTKPIISLEEAQRFLASLPAEPKAVAS